jgi:hypothetical protein
MRSRGESFPNAIRTPESAHWNERAQQAIDRAAMHAYKIAATVWTCADEDLAGEGAGK